jgi:hypothetical protein
LTVRKTALLCYGLTAVYSVAGIVIGLLSVTPAIIGCAALVIVSAMAAWKKGYLKMSGLRGVNPQNSPNHSTCNRID